MKSKSSSFARAVSSNICPVSFRGFRSVGLAVLAGGSLATIAAIATMAEPASAMPLQTTPQLAQALPTPLPPLPADGGSGSSVGSGEQFLVLVSGSSDLLLQQVRQVEPGAFVNYVSGRSVIQAGRFSSYQNAQARADQLANFGIGAEVQATDFAGAPIAVTAPTGYDLSFPAPNQTSGPVGAVPSSTVAASPAAIEFGQAAPFQSAAPNTGAAFPPSLPIAPPTANVAPPPLTAPTVVNQPRPSGYYVVVPASMTDLQNVARRLTALGAPNSLVSLRTAPRGPHVAVGPYDDHGIAQEWSNYLRDSGLPGARVHFE